MSANTKIEWCHATVNWWDGCTAVSPACDNCYAKRMAGRLWGTEWGQGKPRHQFIGAAATLRAIERKAKRLGQPLRVFHNSLSDFFDNEVPVQWRINAMRAIVDTPNLIHLLLTKRIGNAANMLEQAFRAVHVQREGWADNVPPNVWIGATIVNQAEADRDIPKLLAVPAAKRFLSMEPMLGPVDLRQTELAASDAIDSEWRDGRRGIPLVSVLGWDDDFDIRRPGIDWVIVGGESGHGARPMHPDWARSLRDQCQAVGVPFLFKQWGEWCSRGPESLGYPSVEGVPRFRMTDAGHNGQDLASDGGNDVWMNRAGKKNAGRLLDGREWNGVPS